MKLTEKLKRLEECLGTSYYADRIAAELLYLFRVSECRLLSANVPIEQACDLVLLRMASGRIVDESTVVEAEALLSEYSSIAKSYTAHCISHAHIDMNWMWGFHETAAVVIETFRTMLTMMNEYPQFTFAQSQASVYHIVEEYAPDMLDEIRARIKEGRWEVTASTWTECDKNMSGGEALSRQILYTKRYLSDLLGIEPESLRLDFEPDTFGHSFQIPEILQNGGIDYYYHCRGCDYRGIYRWQAQSGKEIVVYQEPKWYLGGIEAKTFCDYPIFCRDVCPGGIPMFLKVFGVGDHGGGPTRRDIERILDMNNWPIFPTLRFSTYAGFFKELEAYRSSLPVITGEQNFVFTGCYTSQSRIKMANRLAEARLYDSEVLSSCSTILTGHGYGAPNYAKAWKKVLFSQFHDILPGSCVSETREYCLGNYQETLAYANTGANDAMHRIADAIDTSGISVVFDLESTSEGGGVGFRMDAASGYRFSCAERGNGSTRIFHLFNTTSYARRETVELSLFDYQYDIANTEIVLTDGTEVPFQFIDINRSYYLHRFHRMLASVDLPAFGYRTYVLRQKADPGSRLMNFAFNHDPRQDHMEDTPYLLENTKLRAEFHPLTLALTSLKDKKSGKELISPNRPSCMLTYAEESPRYGMSSWRVGPIMKTVPLNECTAVRVTNIKNEQLQRSLSYEICYSQSKIQVTVSLNGENDILEFAVTTDWHEVGSNETCIPRLDFRVPVSYRCDSYRYNAPYGVLKRSPMAHDVPALSFMELPNADSANSPYLIVTTDTKYGYRGYESTGSVALLRSSFHPDPLPESGISRVRIGIAVSTGTDVSMRLSDMFNHPIHYATGKSHPGILPVDGTAFHLTGSLQISTVKPAEDGGTIFRMYEINGISQCAVLKLQAPVYEAYLCDINEMPISRLNVDQNHIAFSVGAYEIVTLLIRTRNPQAFSQLPSHSQVISFA